MLMEIEDYRLFGQHKIVDLASQPEYEITPFVCFRCTNVIKEE
jgi:hypothetical protein